MRYKEMNGNVGKDISVDDRKEGMRNKWKRR